MKDRKRPGGIRTGFKGSKVIVQKPDYLDQTYETEHYDFIL